jgi:4-hydroxybenzoate polyprenyltransferase
MAVYCLFVVKYWVASQSDTLKGGKLGLLQAGMLLILLAWTAISMGFVINHYWDPASDCKWFTTRPWKLGLICSVPAILLCLLLGWAFWTMKNTRLNYQFFS